MNDINKEMKKIKKNLWRAFRKSRLTQEEIGYLMGYRTGQIARATVSYILSSRSNPTLMTLVRFAHALGVTLGDIL